MSIEDKFETAMIYCFFVIMGLRDRTMFCLFRFTTTTHLPFM